MLPGCLASVRGAIDEAIVVDTGSRDATRSAAEQAKARVFDFAWRDDFAAARNEALRHATGDWVLVLDADERLAPGAAPALRNAVSRGGFECGMLPLHDASSLDARFEDVICGAARDGEPQLVPRLLRRTNDLAYVDAIHENVLPWLRRRNRRLAAVGADIVHLGATKEVVFGKHKIDRNVRLLEARLRQDPDDLVAYGYLVHDYLRGGRIQEAHEATRRGWERATAAKSIRVSFHRLAIARAYLLIPSRRFGEIRETIGFVRQFEGDNPDFAFVEAYSWELEGRYATDAAVRSDALGRARDGYLECLRFGGRLFVQAFVGGATSWAAHTRMGTVRLLRGEPKEALRSFEGALALRPSDREPLLGRAEAMIALGDAAGALKLIETLLDGKPDAWVLAAAAAAELGRPQDAALFARRASTLAQKGFVAPHRCESLRALLAVSAPVTPPATGRSAQECL